MTINGLTYEADTTYFVNYTTFTKMVVAGAMKTPTFTTTSTNDVVADEVSQIESKPVRKPTRRRTNKK